MGSLLGRVFRGFFTSIDNSSYELGRALWALGCFSMIAYQGFAIIGKGQAFNAMEFGTGFGGLLVAGGFGVAAKDKIAASVKGAAD